MAVFLNWNIERRPPQSWQAKVMMERLVAANPEVACLTEAFENSASRVGGHVIAVRGPAWSKVRHADERLVLLWSRNPWRDVEEPLAELRATGGYVAGLTDTTAGPIRVIGICAPHHFASPVDAPSRAGLWSEQIAFWNTLATIVRRRDRTVATVLLGDFNQYAPRIWGSRAAHEAMMLALDDMRISTSGPILGTGEPTIDHVAHSSHLVATDLGVLSRFGDNGAALSDHFGVVVRLAPSAGLSGR